jgi:hypothetical protein
MRVLTLITAAGLLSTGLLVPAAAAAADPCLNAAAFGAGTEPLRNADGVLRFAIQGPDCTDGGTITIVNPAGAASTAAFTTWDVGDANHGPASYGTAPIPLATGAGTWRITALHHGGATATLSYQVHVVRDSAIVLDADPLVVPPGSRAVVAGVLQQYTSRGTRVPLGAGIKVNAIARELQHLDTQVSGSATTDIYGRFTITLSPARSSQLEVYFGAAGAEVPGSGIGGTVLMQRQVRLMSANLEPSQFTPTTIRAIAWPAGTRMNLEQYSEADVQWVRIQYGNSDSSGNISLIDTPYNVGSQRMRLVVYSNDDGPAAVREFTRVVKYATALDGVTNPTNTTVITPGTKMSTYGHLKITKFGASTGYIGQRVEVQTRPRGQVSVPYATVATATTSGSTGYYYANWNVTSDVDVRVQFLSTDADVKNTWKYIRVVDVR